jgi:hypothetical protein
MLRILDSVLRGHIGDVKCVNREIEMREGMVIGRQFGDASAFCERP